MIVVTGEGLLKSNETLKKPRDIGSSGRRKHGLRLYVTGRKEEV